MFDRSIERAPGGSLPGTVTGSECGSDRLLWSGVNRSPGDRS
jgi:hypothetical protein